MVTNLTKILTVMVFVMSCGSGSKIQKDENESELKYLFEREYVSIRDRPPKTPSIGRPQILILNEAKYRLKAIAILHERRSVYHTWSDSRRMFLPMYLRENSQYPQKIEEVSIKIVILGLSKKKNKKVFRSTVNNYIVN